MHGKEKKNAKDFHAYLLLRSQTFLALSLKASPTRCMGAWCAFIPKNVPHAFLVGDAFRDREHHAWGL